MANYPTSLPSATPATHGVVLGELVAIATELGLDPSGTFSDVKARLDATLIASGLYFETTTLSGTGSFPIFVAPFSCRVLSAEMVIWDGTMPTPSDAAWWDFDIRKYKAGALTAISGVINTKTTGGIIRTNRTGYNWDASSWATVTVDKDDIVALACLMTGSPGVLGPKIGVTVRYMPL